MTLTAPQLHPEYHHRALLHRGPEDLATRIGPTLTEAFHRYEPVHLSLALDEWTALRDLVGPVVDRAESLAAPERYANPGRAMAAIHDFVQRATSQGAAAAWSVGTVQIEGDAHRDARWARYESAVETILGLTPLKGICVYDVNAPAEVLSTVRRCHAYLDEPGVGLRRCTEHRPYQHETVHWQHREATPVIDTTVTRASQIRHDLSETLHDVLGSSRIDDLQLVATELVTNGMRHGDGPVTLRAWDQGDQVVIEVSDSGGGIDDPYADLRPQRGGANGGWGMWLLGQLADQVSIGRESDRTVVLAALRRS